MVVKNNYNGLFKISWEHKIDFFKVGCGTKIRYSSLVKHISYLKIVGRNKIS